MTTYIDRLSHYVNRLFTREDQALKRARKESPERGLPAINVGAEEGRFLQFLARAGGGGKAVEIGTLGGYSGIWIARGLLPEGRLYTLEVEGHHADVARDHFEAAGLAEKVEVRVGNAHDLLNELSSEAPFDFVFIDAEKVGYLDYYDWAVEHLRQGGILAAHNAFRGGRVVDESADEESTLAIRAFNQRAAEDERVISTIFPAGDGTLIAIKSK